MKLRELKQERAALVDKQRAIIDKAEKDGNRDLTVEEQTSYDEMGAEFDGLTNKIKRVEAQDEREALIKGQGGTTPFKPEPNANDDEPAKAALKKEAFFAHARRGNAAFEGPRGHEFRNALEVGTDSEGGYLVPQEWEAGLIKDMAEISVVRRLSRVSSSSRLTNLPVRTSRGTFTLIAEEGSYPTPDPAYGNITLSAWKVGGIILVSEELLRDNDYNLESELGQDATEEFADVEEGLFCTGTGSSQPEGIFTVTAVAGTSLVGQTAASTTLQTADEMIDTYHTLGRKHRRNATWLTSDTVAKNMRKLKDTTNQYIWQPGLQAGEPDTFLGRPVEVSDSATTPAATVRSVVFGDFGYYRIMDRQGIAAQRLDQLYAATGQIGFKFHKRVDAKLTLAPAFTFLDQAAV